MKDAFASVTQNMENLKEQDPLSLYWTLAQLSFARSDFALGLQYGQQAAALAPNNYRLRMLMLDVARLTGNVDAAQDLLGQIQKLDSGGVNSRFAQAVVDVTSFSAAVQAAAEADKKAGDSEGTRTKAAREKNLPLLAKAQTVLKEVANIRSQWSNVPVLQGVVAEMQGNREEAIDFYRRAITLGDRNTTVAFRVVQYLAQKAIDEGNSDLWLEADQVIRKLQDQRSALPYDLGRLASEVNFFAQNYDRALDLAMPLSESGEVRDKLWVGQVAMALKDYKTAEEKLQEAIDDSPEEPMAWTSMIRCLMLASRDRSLKPDEQKTKVEAAEKTLEKALAAVPAEQCLGLEAECLRLMGKTDEAIKLLRDKVAEGKLSPAELKDAAQFFASELATHDDAVPILERFVGGDLAVPSEPSVDWAARPGAHSRPRRLRVLRPRDQAAGRELGRVARLARGPAAARENALHTWRHERRTSAGNQRSAGLEGDVRPGPRVPLPAGQILPGAGQLE